MASREIHSSIDTTRIDALLMIINTPEKYAEFKRWLANGSIRQSGISGPIYAGLPAKASAIDVYDPDKQLLSSNRKFLTTYARIIHANLTGQYRLGADNGIPRLRSGQSLERHAISTYFAPFQPVVSVPLSQSVLSRWDRNSSLWFPATEKPVIADTSQIFWQSSPSRREEFRRLLPLYTDYQQAGEGTIVNSIGVPLNRNTVALFQYVRAMIASAKDYNKLLKDVAMLIQQKRTLQRSRRETMKRLVEVQRRKIREISDVKRFYGKNLNLTQLRAIDQFAEQFQRTVDNLLNR